MASPRIEINLEKIGHNAKVLKALYGKKGIEIAGVTKGVCGDPKIAHTLIHSGLNILADSRLSNLKKMQLAGVKARFMLLRAPLLSEVEAVVESVDISLNTELLTIQLLSKLALERGTIHQIILMVDLGDRREGVMPSDMANTVRQVLQLDGVKLLGIGTNLACFAGVKPDNQNMNQLSEIAGGLEEEFSIKLPCISGGSSANYNWLMQTNYVNRVNNLRLGESIYLGREPLNRNPIPELFTNAFTLIAEVIEIKTKPSSPFGDIGQNAFGEKNTVEDQGPMRRAILGIGLQDVAVSGLTPVSDMEILGASSDHLIVNAKQTALKVGDEVAFLLNYAALLSAMTSPYVKKKYNE